MSKTTIETLGVDSKTSRGFELVEFKDANEIACSLQQSSATARDSDEAMDNPGSSFIWLGTDLNRMHLERNQVEGLVDRLQRWLATGSFAVLLFAFLLVGSAIAQPAAKIVGPKEAPAGELVVLSSTGSTGENLKWVKPEGLQTLQVGCSLLDTQVVFATTKPGVYKFMLIVADKEARIDFIEHTVTIGGTVQPPPVDPGDPIKPPLTDPSPTKWTALQNASKAAADRMNDSSTRSKLKAAIAAVALDIGGRCEVGQCPTVEAAKDQVKKAIEQTLLARTGPSAQLDWTQWRKANQAELDRLGIVDCKDYLAAVRAIGSGL